MEKHSLQQKSIRITKDTNIIVADEQNNFLRKMYGEKKKHSEWTIKFEDKSEMSMEYEIYKYTKRHREKPEFHIWNVYSLHVFFFERFPV